MSISAKTITAGDDYTLSRWTADHVAAISTQPMPSAPLIGSVQALPLLPKADLWDLWPVQNADGSVAEIANGTLWMVLSAPCLDDPNMRHNVARTRLLHHCGNTWQDCGLLFPDDLNPGSREWSGSARYDVGSNTVVAYFTAAGQRGEMVPSFEQRLFQTSGHLDLSGQHPVIVGWNTPEELVLNDGTLYASSVRAKGESGNIIGFRDPYWFCDSLDGCEYILFTGSLPGSAYECSGVIGIARANCGNSKTTFSLMSPIVSADGVANEMERLHMLKRDGLYYLFWSTQHRMFASNGPKGPTGLYGMVGPSITGPFKPLNGTGLVIANPPEEPRQAYCWQVLDTLDVVSFVDHWGLMGRDVLTDPVLNRTHFGGTIAPMLKIEINGATTKLLGLA